MGQRFGSVAVVVAVVALAGCTVTAGDTPATTQPPAPVTAGPNDIVWREELTGGLVSRQQEAKEVPEVVIYGDGRVYARNTEGSSATVRYLLRQASPDDLARFLADAEQSGLFDDEDDYGSPTLPDQGTTTVEARFGDDTKRVRVLGLSMSEVFDLRGMGLSGKQADRREELVALTKAAGLVGSDPQPYVPERIEAHAFGELDDLDPDDVEDPDGIVPWPGRPLAELGGDVAGTCTVLEGDEAHAVYERAQTHQRVFWSEGDRYEEVVVAPLLPDQAGCED